MISKVNGTLFKSFEKKNVVMESDMQMYSFYIEAISKWTRGQVQME